MPKELYIYNSLTRKKEAFVPIEKGKVGMYVCGPTVYSEVHLGNVRTFVSFDIIYRQLLFLGNKVRYVRNITDVGHLLDDGEDRISKGARMNDLEPMEVVQKYTLGFHTIMEIFNALPPSIEPRATGHILEQIEMVEKIIDNGLAYEKNGSVYFDTIKFSKENDVYGKLSGRILDELLVETRELKSQDEKQNPADFAIWMKAQDDHLMKWNSPWSEGFPGWHLECSVMSTKYLGKTFDIHGGGNDLKFPHHENEIAQNYGACETAPANYWVHTNMLLMNGKKMSKSDGNTISPYELFSGESTHVSKGYSPMVVRFFCLQSHYRSTMDLTDGALQAAEKGYKRLMEGNRILAELEANGTGESDTDIRVNQSLDQAFSDMNDDFNTPKSLSRLFEIVTVINSYKNKQDLNMSLSQASIERMQNDFESLIFNVFGLKDDMLTETSGQNAEGGLMNMIIELRKDARENKNWAVSDKIRDGLNDLNIELKDGKEGTSWSKK